MADNELQQAITAIKSGDKELGRSILVRVIQEQPNNELTWLWLSACVNIDEQKRDCLKKVLGNNPVNLNTHQFVVRLSPFFEPTSITAQSRLKSGQIA